MRDITPLSVCLWTTFLTLGVPETAAASQRGPWASCQGAICSEVQRQAEGLTRLKLLRNYVVQTMQLMDSLVTSLDEELVKTGKGLSVFIGPNCESAHSLLKHVTKSNISVDRYNSATIREDLDVSESRWTSTQSTLGDVSHRHEGDDWPNVIEESSDVGGSGFSETHETQYVAQTSTGGGSSGTDGSSISFGDGHSESGGSAITFGSTHSASGGSAGTFGGSPSESGGSAGTFGSTHSGPGGSAGTFGSTHSGPGGSAGTFGSTHSASGGSAGTFGSTHSASGGSAGTFGGTHSGSGSSHSGTKTSAGASGGSHSASGGSSWSHPGSKGLDGGSGGRGHGSGSGWRGGAHSGSKGPWAGGKKPGGGKSIAGSGCRGVGTESSHWVPGLDAWCEVNCAAGFCPVEQCIC